MSRSGSVIVVALIVSASALAAAPWVVGGDYSWVSNTLSEAAAQGVQGAWVAQAGFAIFGLTVGALAFLRRHDWGLLAGVSHTVFALMMLAAADFSVRPWESGAPYDHAEDALHSVAATTMGFAFVVGVLLVYARRDRPNATRRVDLLVAVLATVLPLLMLLWPDVEGLIQRVLFLVAYLWYGREATTRPGHRPADAGAIFPPTERARSESST
ncbi:MAG: DUF998 domain-containing protein [Actinomycetota bacterium]